MGGGAPPVGPRQPGGWAFQILPYMEQPAIYNSNNVCTVRQSPVKGYFCPSRRSSVAFQKAAGGWAAGNALMDYSASNQDRPDCWDGSFNSGTGVIRHGMSLTTLDIHDGTTNTIMIGEKRLCLATLGQGVGDDDHGYSIGWDVDTVSRTDFRPAPDPIKNCTVGCDPIWNGRFGSSHSGGFNAAMADGSVRRIGYSVSEATFTNLGNTADGNLLQNDY